MVKCDERRRRDVDTATVPVMLRRRRRRDRDTAVLGHSRKQQALNRFISTAAVSATVKTTKKAYFLQMASSSDLK
ncbi:hypothetical protein F2Q69_00014480 [Brassica cretica]|uniref:Uncharacterized protein n=1 Tax=Brassica cretica TaxID=69181 RepID=A0A8S9R7K9_BRACR|nr:hypothetical protein F2Q69_00014480 [Brassica cretica]